MYGITFVCLLILQCRPIAGTWDKSIKAQCLGVKAVGYPSSIIGIFQDVVILIMPITQCANLKIPAKKKVTVFAMFFAGIM